MKKKKKPALTKRGAPTGPTKKPTNRPKIPEATQKLLWGCASGRCEFRGCHKQLWKATTTLQQVNLSDVAHIIAFSVQGPRGNQTLSPQLSKDLSNLMLLCDACHKLIDAREKDYPIKLLREMKREHEAWVEMVTSGAPDLKTHLLFYGENIGSHGSPLNFKDALNALLPTRHPFDDQGIKIGVINSSLKDSDPEFWKVCERDLRQKYHQQLHQPLSTGAIRHLSVFARAPQPLLILLGTLLGEIYDIEVFQRRKDPPSWKWEDSSPSVSYTTAVPTVTKPGDAALVLSLSATVTDQRIIKAIGSDIPIWRVTLAKPDNDFVRSRAHTEAFRTTIRPLLNQIKTAHGDQSTLHVFPVMPVSLAVDFGRVVNLKADMRMTIYDENKALGGFRPAITFGGNTPTI